MNRLELRAMLAHLSFGPGAVEDGFRHRMLDLLDGAPDCFLRTAGPAHFTGSALVVSADGRRVLLHHHRKLDRWLQFGGHCDGDEDVRRVAQREALEESGVKGLQLVLEEPLDLDIHEIPACGEEPAHFHYDVRYLLRAPMDATSVLSAESHELRWFTPEEFRAHTSEPGMRRMAAKWAALDLPAQS